MGLIANVEKKKKAVRKLEKKDISKVDSKVKQDSLDSFKKREKKILKKVEKRVKLQDTKPKEKTEVSPKVEELKKKDEAKLEEVKEKVADENGLVELLVDGNLTLIQPLQRKEEQGLFIKNQQVFFHEGGDCCCMDISFY